MTDNRNNKMPPDPQFEELGWRGWLYFKQTFEEIKQHYDQYGDIVLKKRLGESIAIYKDAFSSENDFIGEIRKIWEERYHCVASTFEELISFYKTNRCAYFLPDTDKTNFGGEEKGAARAFAISMDLYSLIMSKYRAYNKDGVLLLVKDNEVYEMTRDGSANTTYYRIKIRNIKAITID